MYKELVSTLDHYRISEITNMENDSGHVLVIAGPYSATEKNWGLILHFDAFGMLSRVGIRLAENLAVQPEKAPADKVAE
jgi:hypothetical protein